MSALARSLKRGASDPVSDWFVLVVLSAIILAGIIVWHIWAFDTVARGGTLGGGGSATQVPFDTSSLSATHTLFDMRATEAAKYTTGVYRFADPSQ